MEYFVPRFTCTNCSVSQVTVLDTNDNDPVFDTPEQTVYVNENEPPGLQVARVMAKDRDSGENAYISYLIANLAPVPFEVDHFTGWVRTTQVSDRQWVGTEAHSGPGGQNSGRVFISRVVK